MKSRKLLEWGGIVAGAVLIAFGVGALVMSINGHNTVTDSLKQERITKGSTTGMNPSTIAEEAKAAGLPDSIPLPTCSVEGKDINSSSRARCFAQYMRIHALESTGGLTYSQMGRYAAKDGGSAGTNDVTAAKVDPATNRPISNSAREIWVTETALSTALNVSFMADNLALFGIVVGVALLLSGIGFMILAVLALGRAARTVEAPKPQRAPTPVTG